MTFPTTTYSIRFADGHRDITSDEILALELARDFRRGNHPSSRNKSVENIFAITCASMQIDDIIDNASTAPTDNVGINRTVEPYARAGLRARHAGLPILR